jgi:hypothetical protein
MRGFSRFPALAGLATDVMHRDPLAADVHHRKNNGKLESPRADGARVHNDDAFVPSNEWYVRVAANDNRCAIGMREFGDFTAEFGAVHRDMHKQQRDEWSVDIADVDGDDVGEIGRVNIDVASHSSQIREFRELIEHSEVADVASMKNVHGMLRCDVRGTVWMRCAMGVGNEYQTGAGIGDFERLSSMSQFRRCLSARFHSGSS